MIEYTRVRDRDTGHCYSVVSSAVDPDAHEPLFDDDGNPEVAINPDGTPLPVVHAPAADGPLSGGYEAATNSALNEEIARRNRDRSDGDEIVPAGKKKDDLVAALYADDQS